MKSFFSRLFRFVFVGGHWRPPARDDAWPFGDMPTESEVDDVLHFVASDFQAKHLRMLALGQCQMSYDGEQVIVWTHKRLHHIFGVRSEACVRLAAAKFLAQQASWDAELLKVFARTGYQRLMEVHHPLMASMEIKANGQLCPDLGLLKEWLTRGTEALPIDLKPQGWYDPTLFELNSDIKAIWLQIIREIHPARLREVLALPSGDPRRESLIDVLNDMVGRNIKVSSDGTLRLGIYPLGPYVALGASVTDEVTADH